MKLISDKIEEIEIYYWQLKTIPSNSINVEELNNKYKAFREKYETIIENKLYISIDTLFKKAQKMKLYQENSNDVLTYFNFKDEERAGRQLRRKSSGNFSSGTNDNTEPESFMNSEYFRDFPDASAFGMPKRVSENIDSSPTISIMEEFEATKQYSASSPYELTINPGDIIAVTQKDDTGWWYGECNFNSGWFPSNNVHKYK